MAASQQLGSAPDWKVHLGSKPPDTGLGPHHILYPLVDDILADLVHLAGHYCRVRVVSRHTADMTDSAAPQETSEAKAKAWIPIAAITLWAAPACRQSKRVRPHHRSRGIYVSYQSIGITRCRGTALM
jgi:hypothetical protein